MTDTTSNLYTSLSVTDADESQVLITGEIPADIALSYKQKALKSLGRTASLDGFRPGKVPEDVIEKRLGEQAVWNEIASLAISEAYPQMVAEKELNVVGNPAITITKLAPGNPIGFSITVGVMPNFTLPDYKAAAKEALAGVTETDEVTDADIEAAIQSIRQNHAHAKWHRDHPDDHSHSHDIPEENLPIVDDAFAQTLGGFQTVNDLKEALKGQVKSEKEYKLKETRRQAIAEKLVEKTPFAVPPIFIQSELNKMTSEFESTIGRMGIDPVDYLTKIGKTIEGLHAEWRPEAKKRAQLQLIINKIGAEEKVEIDQERLKREAEHIIEHYPEANPANVHAYVETMLSNNKVFEILESVAIPKTDK